MTNCEILTESFLNFSDTKLRKLKRYEEAGNSFLCGELANFYCIDFCG